MTGVEIPPELLYELETATLKDVIEAAWHFQFLLSEYLEHPDDAAPPWTDLVVLGFELDDFVKRLEGVTP